jgi:imidazoleglycerol phosphate synthase glutamine amidotransferase subunit HisH
MPKVVIFDYSVDNLLSLKCALEKVGVDISIGTSEQDLVDTDAIALSGVGNFMSAGKRHDCTKEIIQSNIAVGVRLC